MKITHLSGPKAGTTEHIENTVGRTLIAMGLAEEVVPARRGSREWHAELLERQRAVLPPTIEWGIRETADAKKPLIVKQIGAETYFFEAPPKDCPPSILARYREMINVRDPEGERERIAQEGYRHKAREAAERKGTFATLFAGKG